MNSEKEETKQEEEKEKRRRQGEERKKGQWESVLFTLVQNGALGIVVYNFG